MTNGPDPQAGDAADMMLRVRAAMADQGVNQSELARRSGFSRGYVSRLFSDGEDRREATLSTALLLAHKLGIIRFVEDDGR